MSILTQDKTQDPSISTINNSIPKFTQEQPLEVFWDKDNGEWYRGIGFYMGIDKCKICIDHKEWVGPHVDDVQDIVFDQIILSMDVEGQWEFRKRQPIYILNGMQFLLKTGNYGSKDLYYLINVLSVNYCNFIFYNIFQWRLLAEWFSKFFWPVL